jgi:hypothetical protein
MQRCCTARSDTILGPFTGGLETNAGRGVCACVTWDTSIVIPPRVWGSGLYVIYSHGQWRVQKSVPESNLPEYINIQQSTPPNLTRVDKAAETNIPGH